MDMWKVDRLRPEPSHPEVLRSDDGVARVLTMAIKRGVVQEHEGYEHGWLMVLDGVLEIACGGVTTDAGPGTLVHFDPYERRKVTAKTNLTVIYLLAPWPGPGHPSTAEARDKRRKSASRETP